ncbi:Probable short-chain type dehydrogenase/reductase [Candidatus Phaeomarinobacter ectocarpi]|uniref:Probable short-chain type dehydrogenase/reductase n=1 Tax=Candidatus Phaeomarinibacter ectocarpi TaxID=1458461 RepID=X5MNW2_9HYPH|nr:SDR family oxidoreductase [Candidatus Phaeomarinobacter ectocarpi]CDO60486.1 Probable short-chain type dehydrogenase/reductase [Candidatus Phaeomarinobacter ectocarpi]
MSKSGDRKSIFITGAASGMGKATADLFAEKGWFVGATDVNEAGLQALESEIGADNCFISTLDVTDGDAFASVLEAFAKDTGGTLDLLFNNAGIGAGGFFDEMTFDEVMAVVNVNFVGVMRGIHLAYPLLKATPNSLCFTTSSSSATYGMPGIAVYSATKHAVKGLTEALSIEFARHGVRAADVLPGLIDTPILPEGTQDGAPTEGMFRLMPASSVADSVWDAYHTPEKLHWYVPEEIGDLDKAAGNTPELVREQIKSTGPLAAVIREMEEKAAAAQ